MRRSFLERLQPVCPRCLHGDGTIAPLTLASVAVEQGDHLIQAILHCSNHPCWQEDPVIDGVPILVPDPRGYLSNTAQQILARGDLAEDLESLIGDSLGPGTEFDTTRYHLSLYAGDHYADWCAERSSESQIAETVNHGIARMGNAVSGAPALDLGCSVGRGTWALAAAGAGPVLGADLNFAMLRMAQSLLIRGEVTAPRRRVGLVYERVHLQRPDALADADIDFWLTEALALPIANDPFATVTTINLVDCVAGPANLIGEIARVLAPGGGLLLTTPYDWSTAATDPQHWLGGHSQRAEGAGASEPQLRAVLAAMGLTIVAEDDERSWYLTLHDRSTMHYRLHSIAARKTGSDAESQP